jgi:hypothetical protein
MTRELITANLNEMIDGEWIIFERHEDGAPLEAMLISKFIEEYKDIPQERLDLFFSQMKN